MNDIDSITNAWARWKAAQFGTSYWFTESTQYDRNKDTRDYKQYETRVSAPRDLSYSSTIETNGGTALLGRYDSINDGAQVIQHTVSLQQGFTDTFTWSVTEQVKVGVSVTVKAGIPEVGGAEQSSNIEVSLSSTQGASTTRSSNYGSSTTVPISPHTHGWGEVDLAFTNLDTKWVGNVELRGDVAVWFNNKVAYNNNGDYHYLWFIPIETVISECVGNGIIDTRGYALNGGGGVFAQASGTFHSSAGLNIKTISHEEAYPKSRSSEAVNTVYSLSSVNAKPAKFAEDKES